MKIAIVYTSKSGTTATCADLLRRELSNHDVTVLEMSSADIAVGKYDLIVLGFPIRMGKAARGARVFMKKNRDLLLNSRVAYFICCGFIDCFEDYAKGAIPKEFCKEAVAISCFGGNLDPSRVKGIDKIIVKAVRDEILGGGENGDQRSDMSLPTILESNIVQFSDLIKKCN